MSRRFKHPESGHWLKAGNNHRMANRNRTIESSVRFAQEESWELLNLIAETFAQSIVRGRKVIVDRAAGSDSYIELEGVFEAL